MPKRHRKHAGRISPYSSKLDPCPICERIAQLRLQVLREPRNCRALNFQITQAERSHPRCPFCTILVGETHLETELVETELGPMCEHCDAILKRQGKQAFKSRPLGLSLSRKSIVGQEPQEVSCVQFRNRMGNSGLSLMEAK